MLRLLVSTVICGALAGGCQRSIAVENDAGIATLHLSVVGDGTVSVSPDGASCADDCSAQFPPGTTLTLTATPASGAVFVSFGGACSGSEPICAVTLPAIAATTEVIATFRPASTTVTSVPPPSDLTYTPPILFCIVGTPCALGAPSSAGGAIVSFSISPALPAGLGLDPIFGAISGTPTAAAAGQNYTVTASNTGGSATTTIRIEVDDLAPSALTYSPDSLTCTLGIPCSLSAPTSSGGTVVSYEISPALPSGLSFDPTTGALSGTPAALSAIASYSVLATNSGGSASTSINIEVIVAAPSLVYSPGSFVCTLGIPCTIPSPMNSGGAIDSYSIDMILPAGLSLDLIGGAISGTPTALAGSASYNITGTNTTGSSTATLSLAVDDVPPVIVYSPDVLTCYQGSYCALPPPANTGGAVLSYSVANSLPPGLSLDPMGGAIAGVPTDVSTSQGYTIVASNTGGQGSANISIVVDRPLVTSGMKGVIASGATHACALASGGVWCWGDNTYGQLGNSVPASAIPVQVTGLSGAQALAAGDDYTCAVVDGSAWCWGRNEDGQLGNNTTVDSAVPTQVRGLNSGVQAISAGDSHACALVNGAAVCWGHNSSGQLGNGTTTNSTVPVQVTGLSSGVELLAAGSLHVCALVNGGVRCWGDNGNGQLGVNTDGVRRSSTPVQVAGLNSGVQSITSGGYHSCALIDGAVSCWGYNADGELGNGSTTNSSSPVSVDGLASDVQSISGGEFHTCAMVDGAALCWGFNQYGELGDGTHNNHGASVQTPALSGGAQALSAGYFHTCALVNGSVQCWGYNGDGELGNNSPDDSATSVQVSGIEHGIGQVAVGAQHICALVDGAVQCWGNNSDGQLGYSAQDTQVPGQVLGISSGVQALAAGYMHTCALVNGGVSCWGLNINGELGNSSQTNSTSPVQVAGLDHGVQAISAHGDSTCALVNGGVLCWGDNTDGELGNNTTMNSAAPVAVVGLGSGVESLASGDFENCAVANGGLSCWGENSYGQLGNQQTVNSPVPVQALAPGSGVQAAAAGEEHTCAIVNGAVQCFGDNGDGELGSGVPDGGVQALAAGDGHTCALVNGSVSCWGLNVAGELGDDTNNNSPSPVPAIGMSSGVQQLGAGGLQSCAVANGALYCWGDNAYGQLGDNSTNASSVPLEVVGLLGL